MEGEIFKAAVYLRLSREEGDKAESDSIGNQRELIRSYVKSRPDLMIAQEYVDDGYSGSNFERPGFKRMVEDAGAGIVNCIIVKDLSRFGRNYIDTGRYLERIFPMLRIRFIAINDGYDSFVDNGASDQLLVPFKNLINDAYCRDISVKIKSQLEVKRRNGECVSGFAVYGYLKDPKDRHKLIIDPYAADVVRLIYSLKLDGMNSKSIAKRLDSLGVLPPSAYKRSIGINYNSGFRTKDDVRWVSATIDQILMDETYTGVLVQGRYKKPSHRMKKCVKTDEKDWIRVEGTHEAIISKAEFAIVKNLMGRDTGSAPGAEKVYLFSGFLKCGNCGQNMTRTPTGHYVYYICCAKKSGIDCPMGRVSETTIYGTVLRAINRQAELLIEAEAIIESGGNRVNSAIVDVRNKQMAELDREIERFKDLKAGLNQDLRDGVISREEFTELSGRFSGRIQDAEHKRDMLASAGQSKEGGSFPEWFEEFKKYRELTKLDRRLLAFLIDEIIVYSKDRVEIRFRFADEIKQILLLAGFIEEDSGRPADI